MAHLFSNSSRKKNRLPLVISVFIATALIAGYFLIPAIEQGVKEAWNLLTSEDNSRIRQWVSGFGWWGPVVIIITMIVQTFL